MHHYPFHASDYMMCTAHLSLEEDAAYRRVLDLYYTTESPIPNDNRAVSRRLRVSEVLLASVLDEFFFLHENAWHNKRCDAEITAYQAMKERNASNGKLGGRPLKNERLPKNNRSVNSGNPLITHSKANQEPITKNQLEEPTVLVDDKSSTPDEPSPIDRVDCPMQGIADAWNAVAVSMPAVKPVAEWADARKRMVKARWVDKLKLKKYSDKTTGIDYWTRLFARVEASDFLAGRGGGTFTATLDWVMNPTNLAKIIENGYPNRQVVPA